MESALGLSYPTIRTRLTALKDKLQSAEPVPEAAADAVPPRPPAPPQPEPLGAVWHKAVSRSVEAIADHARAKHGGGDADQQGNTIHLSHFEYPEGSDVHFSGNRIRMSKAREFDLQRSAMTDNQFDACRLQEVRLADAKLQQCHFTSSSLDEVALDHSEILALELFSSKWGEVKLKEESRIEGVQMRSSVAKELQLLGGTQWQDSSFNSTVLAEVILRATRFAQCRMDESKFSEVEWDNCEWNRVVTRSVGFERVQFRGCRFDDVVFTAAGHCFGKRWSWGKTRWEDCQLDRVLFSDCQTRHTVIRGVTLQDLQIRGADLSGQTIEGNEAFLRATAAFRA
jgi:uncharacterized protein YjbI with pentapeptide repeats